MYLFHRHRQQTENPTYTDYGTASDELPDKSNYEMLATNSVTQEGQVVGRIVNNASYIHAASSKGQLANQSVYNSSDSCV